MTAVGPKNVIIFLCLMVILLEAESPREESIRLSSDLPFDLFGSIKTNQNSLPTAFAKGLYHQGKPSNTSIHLLSHHQLAIPLLLGSQHTDEVLNRIKERNKTPTTTKKPALDTELSPWQGQGGKGGREDSCFTQAPLTQCSHPHFINLTSAAGAGGRRRRGKVKSVVPLGVTLLRQYPSGTEKDWFRKHKSYFAHMDDNKAT